jgi:hypothetical protein
MKAYEGIYASASHRVWIFKAERYAKSAVKKASTQWETSAELRVRTEEREMMRWRGKAEFEARRAT